MGDMGFKPVTLEELDEGRVRDSVDDELATAIRGLTRYMRKHGEASDGAKASVTFTLALKVENAKDGTCSIKSSVSSKVPGRPNVATFAIIGDDAEGPNLFVRPTGGTDESEDPRQTKIKFDGTEKGKRAQ